MIGAFRILLLSLLVLICSPLALGFPSTQNLALMGAEFGSDEASLVTSSENSQIVDWGFEKGTKYQSILIAPESISAQASVSKGLIRFGDSSVVAAAQQFDTLSLKGPLNRLLDWLIPSAEAAIPNPPGGPILVITSANSTYSQYYAEILRNEGFNEFAVVDVSTISSGMLAVYDVIILAPASLTPGQVTTLTNWVNAGGNLIAMRPDLQLAGLLGLSPVESTLSEGYLLVDTSQAPGTGIVGQTIQFHGIADRYALSGATSLATLYTDATTATMHPALTLRSVGIGGGQAAAFTYDLATSIVYTRQGNPAWATQERDGFTPIRSDDKFYGGSSAGPQFDWVDLNKIAIPQADEQQRLLANLILMMNADKKPLPRFWYFPRGYKAVVIMTGDDHGNGGTAGRFDQFIAASPINCSVADWECVRGTSYIYPDAPLANNEAATYDTAGFEVGLHVNTNCADYTPASLEAFYTQQINDFASKYNSIPLPITQRHHCAVWGDWATGAKVQLNHGIRLDTSYYFWPPSRIANVPSFFTGSAMPMRFAGLDGTLIDVYHAVTQMTDESGQSYPYIIDTLLDRALGAEGYYGAYTINAPTDVQALEADTVVASALARSVPIVSSRQMLTWLDGRNSSSFGSIAWSNNALSFTVSSGFGANGLQALVPMISTSGMLANITQNGNPVSFSVETVKGIVYARFSATAGAYVATYAADTTLPTVTGQTSASAHARNVTLLFTTADGAIRAWSDSTIPAHPSWNDPNAMEMGVKFRVDVAGVITGIRFYKGSLNTGTHVGNLWTSSGQNLATALFTNETASGWQQVDFATPVPVSANTVYVASYHTNVGNYAAENDYFATAGVDAGPLHLLRDGVSGGNGLYSYSASSTFPTNSYRATNYWVDVVFTPTTGPDTTPPTVTGRSPTSGATGVAVNSAVTATFSEALDPATVSATTFELRGASNALIPASVSYNAATNTATLTPTAPLSVATLYTATLKGGPTDPRIKDLTGNALAQDATWSFTTSAGSGGCSSPANPIVAENCLAGNPATEWDVSGSGDLSIQGFATDISVNRGETVFFKINTPSTDYRLDVYRLGYYGGNGARKVATIQPSATLPQNQPSCLADMTSGLIDCGNWAVSASWPIPATAISGIYLAKAIREDGSNAGKASHIVFIVRDDSGASDLLFQTSDATWQAYNEYGGNSLYFGQPAGRAYKVSYNRPILWRLGSSYAGISNLFNAEYPMVRWLEANGFNVSYFTGNDSDRRGALIQNHKVFLSVGHDEYWSAQQRSNVEAALQAGVNLAFFSGNEVFWKTRWETSIDGSGTPHRTLVCYKETHAGAPIDPLDPPTWTGTWRDPRFSPPADGGRPENALTGQIFTVNGVQFNDLTVSPHYGKMRFWRNTGLEHMGDLDPPVTVGSSLLGFEWDEDLDNGHRPAGLIRLSSTSAFVNGHILDYGSNYAPGNATHSLTLYRHGSGALVFGAGTIQWSWGLDGNHDNNAGASNFGPDIRIKQATVNLFADMGVQPQNLQSGLVAASASTDTAAPASTIASPMAGTNVSAGSPVTVSGTATDTGGGVVGGVEVSVDGGAAWHPANGEANWSYSWIPAAAGSVTIRSRAADDSGNLEVPGAGVTVTVGSGTPPTGCAGSTIWASTAVPAVAAANDTAAVELGVKFRASANGHICGIRFYKGTGNTGTHEGKLWTSGGTLLGTATFAGETASGWQQADFAAPVAVTANTVYVASYYAPAGRYAVNGGYFAAGVSSGPLYALSSGESGGNGVYRYGSGGGFPGSTYNATNYWVDVVFTTSVGPDVTPPTVTGRTPAAGATGVTPSATVTATFSEAVDAATVTGASIQLLKAGVPVSAVVSYNAGTNTATLTPGAALTGATTYTATVKGGASGVKDLAGNALAADATWTFTTAAAATGCTGNSIWPLTAVPAVAAANDTAAVELGVKFRASANGYICGIRFYKGTGNTGTHEGKLWTSGGTLLGTATFAGETASGWQQADFAAPVAVTANTVYVASYYAPAGRYAANGGYFAAGVSSGPLYALSSGESGGNGVYRYGSGGGFPGSTYNATNYWVDVVFTTTP